MVKWGLRFQMDKSFLEKAVSLGIITNEQMEQLLALFVDEVPDQPRDYGEDERFRLISGFNDIFLALGVTLFGVGLYGGVAAFGGLLYGSIFGAVAMWLLSELFAARLRLTLPSIAAAVGFCGFVVLAVFTQVMSCQFEAGSGQLCPRFEDGPIRLALAVTCSGVAAALLYYIRFRLPFSLFLLAIALYVTIFVWISRQFEFEALGSVMQLMTFAFGWLVFFGAMGFDISDRERITRRSDAGFWLHLAAAPLIVHSVMFELAFSRGADPGLSYLAVMAVFVILMVLALMVDRRAILVATLTYVGTVVAYVINKFGSGEDSLYFTLIALGVSVIVLGVGWRPLRRMVVGFLPNGLVSLLPVLR